MYQTGNFAKDIRFEMYRENKNEKGIKIERLTEMKEPSAT